MITLGKKLYIVVGIVGLMYSAPHPLYGTPSDNFSYLDNTESLPPIYINDIQKAYSSDLPEQEEEETDYLIFLSSPPQISINHEIADKTSILEPLEMPSSSAVTEPFPEPTPPPKQSNSVYEVMRAQLYTDLESNNPITKTISNIMAQNPSLIALYKEQVAKRLKITSDHDIPSNTNPPNASCTSSVLHYQPYNHWNRLNNKFTKRIHKVLAQNPVLTEQYKQYAKRLLDAEEESKNGNNQRAKRPAIKNINSRCKERTHKHRTFATYHSGKIGSSKE